MPTNAKQLISSIKITLRIHQSELNLPTDCILCYQWIAIHRIVNQQTTDGTMVETREEG